MQIKAFSNHMYLDIQVYIYIVLFHSNSFCLLLGPTGTEDFVHNVFSVLEAIAQHPVVLMEHHAVTMETILPPLAQLLSSANGKYCVFYIYEYIYKYFPIVKMSCCLKLASSHRPIFMVESSAMLL